MSWLEVVRSSLTMEDVLSRYVGSPNRFKKYLCPFHNDKHPSLSINPTDGRFKCFACGASGDVVDFVRQMFDTDQRGALETLNRDFNLGFDNVKDEPRKIRDAKLKREREKQEREELERRIEEQLKRLFVARSVMWDGYHRTLPTLGENMNLFFGDEKRVSQCMWFYYQSEWAMWLINCLWKSEYAYNLSDCPFHFDLFVNENPMYFAQGANEKDLTRRQLKVLQKLEKGEIEPICKRNITT